MSMFHANAWGMPFAAVMNGSSLVLPGPNLQPERILDLLSTYRVTLTGAVPTVWLGVIDALEREPERWRSGSGLRIIVGGSAAPETLFRRFDRFGAKVIQPWGMTETTPMATVSTLKPHMDPWTGRRASTRVRAKQGLPSPFIEIRGDRRPGRGAVGRQDSGRTAGARAVGGVGLLQAAGGRATGGPKEGWFQTGDVVDDRSGGLS